VVVFSLAASFLQEEVKPKQYQTPEDWLTAAKWEISHGDLHQASEKLYAAGQ
jgi:hypothetical protein